MTTKVNDRRRRSLRSLTLGVLGLAIGVAGSMEMARAVEVDAELVILVDTSIVVSDQDFSDLLEGFASAVTSAEFTGALAGGSGAGVAASLVFFGSAGVQVTGVPWMRLDDEASALAFADLIRGAVRPSPSVTVSLSGALDYGTSQYGSETGFEGNGFESERQVMSVTTETFTLLAEGADAVAGARQRSLEAGVDVINAITVGTFAAAAATAYYEANIVGGEAGGLAGRVVNAPDYASLSGVAANSLSGALLRLIPEPGTVFLTVLGLTFAVLRRRR